MSHPFGLFWIDRVNVKMLHFCLVKMKKTAFGLLVLALGQSTKHWLGV